MDGVSSGIAFHGRQPAWPRWLDLALETEVDGEYLRFRTARGGRCREVALADIERTEAVRLHLRSGRILTLGTRDPEGLRRALQPRSKG